MGWGGWGGEGGGGGVNAGGRSWSRVAPRLLLLPRVPSRPHARAACRPGSGRRQQIAPEITPTKSSSCSARSARSLLHPANRGGRQEGACVRAPPPPPLTHTLCSPRGRLLRLAQNAPHRVAHAVLLILLHVLMQRVGELLSGREERPSKREDTGSGGVCVGVVGGWRSGWVGRAHGWVQTTLRPLARSHSPPRAHLLWQDL